MLIEDWRHDYHRPHSALGMMTPAAFAGRSPSAVSRPVEKWTTHAG